MRTAYRARCNVADCTFAPIFYDQGAYEARAQAVGKHRVTTGHGVRMWDEPVPEPVR